MWAVFLVTLAFSLFSARVASTVYDADFYKRHLAEQDVYGFALGDLASAAIEQPPDYVLEGLGYHPVDALGLSTAQVVDALNAAFPREWVQRQAEGAIDRTIGYLNRDSDDLDIVVAIDERVPAVTRELKSLFTGPRLHRLALEQYAAAEVDEALGQGATPFGVSLENEDVVAAIGRSVPPDWVDKHAAAIIDESSAYLSGRQDTMELRLPLYERADAAAEELKALFAEADFDGAQLAWHIGYDLASRIPAAVDMPFGVSLAGAEVVEAAVGGLSGPWLVQQARLAAAAAAPYVVGIADGFRAEIPAIEVRAAALGAVEALTWARLEARLAALPACAEGETPFRAGAPAPNELPRCLPSGMGADTLSRMMDVDVAGDVERLVGANFPGSVEYTQADLRRGMGGEDSPSVRGMDRLRGLMSDGWTYTDEALLEDWAGEEGSGVYDLRAALSGGWQFTLDDLEELTASEDGGTGAAGVLEQLRSVPVGSAWLTLVLVVALAAMLAAAGLLGGQSRRGRLAWASATLASASFVLLMVFALSVGPAFQNALGEIHAEATASADSPAAKLAAEKVVDVAQAMARDFSGGLTLNALWLFLAGALAFGLSFLRVGALRSSPGGC